jgi:signal transduction histidine kinase
MKEAPSAWDEAEAVPTVAEMAWRRVRDELPESQRETVRALARAIEGTPVGTPSSPAVADALADEALADLSGAVGRLHEGLDRVLADEAAGGEEVRDARRRLSRLTGRLWQESVDRSVEAYHGILRDVSHDIRSPLNSILFLVDGLYSGQSGSLNDAQHRQLGVVYSAAASLLKLVNDLLDFARIAQDETGLVDEVRFSVGGVLQEVRRLVNPIAEHRNCRLRTDVDVAEPRRGDPQMLSRILINLVSNGIDAAADDGSVVVRVGGDEETLQVSVLDDGDDVSVEKLREAIATKDLEQGRLGRILSGRTQGLGLILCGRMIQAAGGEIEVGRTEDGWTRFAVSLPFRKD